MRSMGAGRKFDGEVGDNVPALAEVAGQFLSVNLSAPEDREKAPRRLQHVLVDRITAAGSQCGVDGAQSRVSRLVFARPAIGADCEAAHRRCSHADCVCHLFIAKSEEPGCSDNTAESDDYGSMETLPVAAERLADPARGLISRHDCAEQVFAAGTHALAD